jgi:hypothetical protein
MEYTPRDFASASEEAVNQNLREGHWLIYRHYCAVDPAQGVVRCTGLDDPDLVQELNPGTYDPAEATHGVYVVAPRLLKDPFVDEPENYPRRRKASALQEGIGQDKEVFWEFFNAVDTYAPLTLPGLFLEFAGLANEGEITLDVMMDWVERYGVLGLEVRETRSIDPQGFAHLSGGPMDNLWSFDIEARRANAVLRLYEAATDPDGPDVDKIGRYEEWLSTQAVLREFGHRMDSSAGLRDAALGWVASTVRRTVAQDCYPELYQEGDTFRNGYGFKSLLGAMYLQMMWLMTATGEIRRCQGPGCNKIITFEQPEQLIVDSGLKKNVRGNYRTRKDKRFCSDNCRVKNYLQLRRNAKRLAENVREP